MSVVQIVGWCGTAAFFLRFLVQWLASERAGRSVTPRSFWWLSLFGAVCLAVYSVDRGEPVLLAGMLVNGSIFARNLWIDRASGAPRRVSPWPLALLALAATAVLFASGALKARTGWRDAPLWLACVAVGQAVWSARFVVQWWLTERAGRSHLPRSFWWLSLVGNGLLLAYAAHLGDPIYVAGFLLGPFVQARNLWLLRRERLAGSSPRACA